MSRLPSNLPTLLREAGLTVIEIEGWQTRGRPAETGGFEPVGVLNHHIGVSAKLWSKAKRLAYAKWMFLTGRSDLPPPLCQLSIDPSGVVYVGAAGRANHAGVAKASGTVGKGDGNRLYIGIEWMLSGTERIPDVMMAAGVTVNAVLTEKVTKTSVETISCHYQTSVTGKWDIGDPNGIKFGASKVLDVSKFRTKVLAERSRLYRPKGTADNIVVATNNVMSLPKNKDIKKTLAATPTASVVMVQEVDLASFKIAVASVPGYDSIPLAPSDTINATVLYKPGVWRLLADHQVPQYKGSAGVSKTRHIAVALLEHETRKFPVAFISMHDVTKGEDSVRKRLRRQGRKQARAVINHYRKKGIAVVFGGDMNQIRRVFTTADQVKTHGIDHVYAWNGKGVKFKKIIASRAINTPSDHDAFVVRFDT